MCLIALCVTSTVGLCFVDDLAKWFLMAGCIVSLLVLLYYLLRYPVVVVKTEIVEREVPVIAVEKKEETVEEAVEEAVKEAVEKTVEETAEDAPCEVPPVVPEQPHSEIDLLLSSLEEKHINVFERRLDVGALEMTEADREALFEEFVDIGLLVMDFVKVSARPVCSFADVTKARILNATEKDDLLREMGDPSIRLSRKYDALSKILREKLPGKSFLYSGYKL